MKHPVHFVVRVSGERRDTWYWYKSMDERLMLHPLLLFAEHFEDREVAENAATRLVLSAPDRYLGVVNVVPVWKAASGLWTDGLKR